MLQKSFLRMSVRSGFPTLVATTISPLGVRGEVP
jgi:hypothetical protein